MRIINIDVVLDRCFKRLSDTINLSGSFATMKTLLGKWHTNVAVGFEHEYLWFEWISMHHEQSTDRRSLWHIVNFENTDFRHMLEHVLEI